MSTTVPNAGAEAQGTALADLFNKELQAQGNRLMSFMHDMFVLSLDGRKAFRVEISHILRQRREHVKSFEGTPEHTLYDRANKSASVRLSEAVAVSRAFDAGFNPQWDVGSRGQIVCQSEGQWLTYHSLVAAARVYNESHAQGPTAKRGRKATPALEKAIKYLDNLELSDEDKIAIAAHFGLGV